MDENEIEDESAPLLVSMTVHELYHAATAKDEQLAAFADIVSDRADGIELFVEPSAVFMGRTRDAVSAASELDLTIQTVHSPPIGVREPGVGSKWDIELNTHLKEILLQYEHDETTAGPAEDGATQQSLLRRPKMEPTIATVHPPRFPEKAEVSLSRARRELVNALRASLTHVTSDRFVDRRGPWTVPTIALENVCPRPGFEYLLTAPEDVSRLRAVASSQGDEDVLAFTCDVGHTPEPRRMLDAMETPTSIHVHGVGDASQSTIAERLPDAIDRSQLAVEAADGNIHHLPPNLFPDRISGIIDWLSERDVQCPLVVELQRPCKHPTVANEMFDWIDELDLQGY